MANRPEAWEDDISRNALDNAPFENLAPISERLEELDGMEAPILGDQDLKSFAAKDSLPLPCPDDRERYSVNADGRYWFTGFVDYLRVMKVAHKHGVNVNRMFDFGCASGRVIRHFAVQSNISEIWGSDINARHIRWLSTYMPKQVKPIANHAASHLPFRDAMFDLITAFSVFTHIDTFETYWLAELRRILSDDGLAYVTIHNEDTWRRLADHIDNENNRLVQTMISVDPETPEKLNSEMPPGRTVYRFTPIGPYRAHVFHSNSYIHEVWGRFFDIVDILPNHHRHQSVVILK